jgi:hypothetical protein
MTTNHQNPETAAREELVASASQKLTFEEMVAIRQTVEAALRPTASPGEVTVTEAEPFAWFKTDVNGKPIAFVHHSFDAEVLREQGYALTPVYKTPPALTAALSARPSAPDAEAWQPIETAPLDGTKLWLYWPFEHEDDRQKVGWYELDHVDSPFWTDVEDTEPTPPTHWRPLPSPPALRATTQTETEADNGR